MRVESKEATWEGAIDSSFFLIMFILVALVYASVSAVYFAYLERGESLVQMSAALLGSGMIALVVFTLLVALYAVSGSWVGVYGTHIVWTGYSRIEIIPWASLTGPVDTGLFGVVSIRFRPDTGTVASTTNRRLDETLLRLTPAQARLVLHHPSCPILELPGPVKKRIGSK